MPSHPRPTPRLTRNVSAFLALLFAGYRFGRAVELSILDATTSILATILLIVAVSAGYRNAINRHRDRADQAELEAAKVVHLRAVHDEDDDFDEEQDRQWWNAIKATHDQATVAFGTSVVALNRYRCKKAG